MPKKLISVLATVTATTLLMFASSASAIGFQVTFGTNGGGINVFSTLTRKGTAPDLVVNQTRAGHTCASDGLIHTGPWKGLNLTSNHSCGPQGASNNFFDVRA